MKREILLAVTLMLMGVISEGGAAAVYSDGIDAIQSRDYEEAVQIFQELTAADSQNPELWYQLGFAQRLSGNLEQALECQLQARRLAPERLDVLMELSRLHYWSGRREAGESTLDEVFRISPGHEPALELRGRLAQLGNWRHLFGMGIDGVEREYRQLETYHRARAFGVFQSPEKEHVNVQAEQTSRGEIDHEFRVGYASLDSDQLHYSLEAGLSESGIHYPQKRRSLEVKYSLMRNETLAPWLALQGEESDYRSAQVRSRKVSLDSPILGQYELNLYFKRIYSTADDDSSGAGMRLIRYFENDLILLLGRHQAEEFIGQKRYINNSLEGSLRKTIEKIEYSLGYSKEQITGLLAQKTVNFSIKISR